MADIESLDDLKARAAAAKARREAAKLTDEQNERAKLLADLAEDEAAAAVDEARGRALRGALLEAAAKKEAGGRYLVQYFDLAALLPQADASALPGEGVIVVRSPPVTPVDVLGNFYREVEAKQQALPDIYAAMVLESVVYPNLKDEKAGADFSAFVESSLGRGTVIPIGDVVTALGGVRTKATKRGR